MLIEIKNLAKTASNCMHTLLALQLSDAHNQSVTVTMNAVLSQAAPNQMDPFMFQNNYFGSQKRSETI